MVMSQQQPLTGGPDSQPLDPTTMGPVKPKVARKPSTLDPDQIIKQLAKYCHASSSQFAVILCDADGETRLRASSAFSGYLEEWIPISVRESASQVAISAAGEKAARRRRRDSEMGSGFMEGRIPPPPPDDMMLPNPRKRPGQDEAPVARKKKASESPEMVVETHAQAEDYKPLRIGDEQAVGTFYMTRLRQMQQLMCRIVAKAWIKVIEPKKQSNFPYNRGEESKPSWWPKQVKHKEPDHLLKHERLTLLLTMIRYENIDIAKLEQATAEVMVQIPSNNKDREKAVPLLEEIYRVAKQEERLRRGEISPETVVYVAASETIIKSPSQKAPSPKAPSPKIQREMRQLNPDAYPPPPHISAPLQGMGYSSFQGPDMNPSPVVATSPYLEEPQSAMDYYNLSAPPPAHAGHQHLPIFHNSWAPSHGSLSATPPIVSGMITPYSPTTQPLHSPAFSTQASSAPPTPATAQQPPPLLQHSHAHPHHGQHQPGQMVGSSGSSQQPPSLMQHQHPHQHQHHSHNQHSQAQIMTSGPPSTDYGLFAYQLDNLNGPPGGHTDGRGGIK